VFTDVGKVVDVCVQLLNELDKKEDISVRHSIEKPLTIACMLFGTGKRD